MSSKLFSLNIPILILLSIIVIGCMQKSQGYLEEEPENPLREYAQCMKNKESSLEIIGQQSTRIETLKKQEELLSLRLEKLKREHKQFKKMFEIARKKLEEKNVNDAKLKDQLEKFRELYELQEQQILNLTIEKVQMEQELVALKIKMMKNKQERSEEN